jgi:hypothetical protein
MTTSDPRDPVWRAGRFSVAVWAGLPAIPVLIVVLVAAFSHHATPQPHPAPWSCASLVASLAPVDGGQQIAPVCGQTPYPEVTP